MLVTPEYYSNTYMGEAVEPAAFPRLELRAEELVGRLTRGRVTEANFDALPTSLQNAYMDAICAQIEYMQAMGISVATYGNTAQSFTVGKVRVDGSKLTTGAASMVCPAVIAILEQTGLMNPAVPALGLCGGLGLC